MILIVKLYFGYFSIQLTEKISKMERYIEQLLEDIEEAKDKVPTFSHNHNKELFLMPLQIEREHAPEKPLGEWLGLKKIQFPPSCRLNKNQIKRLMLAMEDLLVTFNYITYFPESYPLQARYDILINHLDKKTPFLTYNFWQIDFCEYDASNCPFGSTHCQCKYWDTLKDTFPDVERAIDIEDNEQLKKEFISLTKILNNWEQDELERILDEDFFHEDDFDEPRGKYLDEEDED